MLEITGYGRLPKWPTGADCKSAGYAFDGSNPSPTTTFLLQGESGFYPNKSMVLSASLFSTSAFWCFCRLLRSLPLSFKKSYKSHTMVLTAKIAKRRVQRISQRLNTGIVAIVGTVAVEPVNCASGLAVAVTSPPILAACHSRRASPSRRVTRARSVRLSG